MTFRVGQKVTMLRPWRPFFNPYPDVVFTEFGEVYTVRDIIEVTGKGTGILVCEIRNQPHLYKARGILEQPFPADNFRPIVETDIGFAHEILRKVTKREDA
jgi:hypothetical protein